MADKWVLIFSDGTGQRGVRDDTSGKNSNVFRMLEAAESSTAGHETFYDAGLGAPRGEGEAWSSWGHRLLSKATGLGISRNIAECYAALMQKMQEGMPIGLFGFSRGAYTVRSLGGVMSACGVPTFGFSRDDKHEATGRRYQIALEAVKIYQIDPRKQSDKRLQAAEGFRNKYKCADVMPKVIGVYDTVRALGLPGVTDIVNPFKHVFHDSYLSKRVDVGLQAYAIDENRKVFKPEPWKDDQEDGSRVLEQVWFPGVHSDIGGGYADDRRLADYAHGWLTQRILKTCNLDLTGGNLPGPNSVLGKRHNERTGFGVFWIKGTRGDHIDKISRTNSPLCADIEHRFTNVSDYRPKVLKGHPRINNFY